MVGRPPPTEKADEALFIRQLAMARQLDPSEISNIVIEQPQRASVTTQESLTPEEEIGE